MNNQKGGRVVFPSEYFGKDSGRYYPEGDANLNISNSAYGVNYPTSRGKEIGNNMTGPELGPTQHSGLQTGGKIVHSSEYFGKDSGRYYPEGDANLKIGDSAYGTNYPTSRGVSIGNNMVGPDLGATLHSGLQTGGEYSYIRNPENGNKVRLNSKIGKQILKKYLIFLKNNKMGGSRNVDPLWSLVKSIRSFKN